MPKAYIINTNKSNNPQAERDMLENEKVAAYFTPWKYYIDTIEEGDIVFLYSSGIGIIARGIAVGIVEEADYDGKKDEEHYMYLNRFEKFENQPMSAASVTNEIKKIAGTDFDIKWNQTMILLAYSFGLKVWQNITKNYL